ncbi:uncharacterized protein LOC144559580 [Carex rostrata]
MVNYIHYETAFEMWKALATTFYDGNDEAFVFDLNRKVTRLKQSGKPVEDYYNALQGLWREIDFRRPNPITSATDIEQFNKYLEKTRVYTFLDGLDDRLDNIRASVLQMLPFPTVEQAYGVVRREAIRQSVMLKGEEDGVQNSMAMVSRGYKSYEGNSTLNKNYPSQEKSKLKCSNCGKTGHVRERCFDLVGYPDWYKGSKGRQVGEKGRNQAFAATTKGDGSGSPDPQGVGRTGHAEQKLIRTAPTGGPSQPSCSGQTPGIASHVEEKGTQLDEGYPHEGDHWAWF